MFKLTDQKGFSGVEAVLILVIVAIVGGVGFFVYSSNKRTNDTLNAAAKVAQSSPSKVTKKKSTSTKSTSQKYLTVKEWGVKLPLDNTTADAYYIFKSGDDKDIYLSLHSLETGQCAADQTSIGAISRFTQNETDTQNNQTYLSEFPQAKKVGSYYYYFLSPQAGCSDDQTIQTKAINAGNSLKQAVSKLQDQ